MRTHHRFLLAAALLALPGCSTIFGGDDTLVLEVAEAPVLCMAMVPQECLLVRGLDRSGELRFLHSGIAGFAPEIGYRYEIVVRRERIRNPPADSPDVVYRLIRIVSKERAPRFDMLISVLAAEQVWNDTRPTSYRMVQERDCFCIPDARGPVRLHVTRAEGAWITPWEQVTSRHYVDDGRTVPWSLAQYFLTAQQLFSQLRFAIASDAHVIDVEYHPTMGYPTRLFVDWQAALADDELGFIVHELVALE